MPVEALPIPDISAWEFKPLPPPMHMGRGVICYAPSDPDRVYAGISGSFAFNGGAMIGIYGST